jgi:hypothetical protein
MLRDGRATSRQGKHGGRGNIRDNAGRVLHEDEEDLAETLGLESRRRSSNSRGRPRVGKKFNCFLNYHDTFYYNFHFHQFCFQHLLGDSREELDGRSSFISLENEVGYRGNGTRLCNTTPTPL